MLTSKQQAYGRKWLIGVPKAMATLRWRITFRSEALSGKKVPEHIRTDGVYCPACGKGQSFSHQCEFCGCSFACFVIMETPGMTPEKQKSGVTALPTSPAQGRFSWFPVPIFTYLSNFGIISRRAHMAAVGTALVILVALVGGAAYYRSHAQKQYAKNYVLAVYGIKSGMSMVRRVCEGQYSAGKEGGMPVASPSAGIDSQASSDLGTVKAEVDRIMTHIGTPPAAFAPADQILRKLYLLYGNTNSLIVSSKGPVSQCRAHVRTADEDFLREIENLKAHLPAQLSEEFRNAGKKYDLRFMKL